MADLIRSTHSTRDPLATHLVPGGSGDPPESDPALAPPDLRNLFGTVRRHLAVVLAGVCFGAGLATYLIFSEVPRYNSKAVIRLEDSRRALTGDLAGRPGDVLLGRTVDPVQSQIEVLTSRAVAASVVDSLGALRLRSEDVPLGVFEQVQVDSAATADSVPLVFMQRGVLVRASTGQVQANYGSELNSGGVRFVVRESPNVDEGVVHVISREAAARRLLNRLAVKPRENTDIIDVIYTDTDRSMVQRAVNGVVTTFQRVSALQAQSQSVRRRTFLQEQLRQNDSVLDRARAELSSFRGRQQALSTRAKLATEQQGLSGIELRRNELEVDRRIYVNLLSALRDGGDAAPQLAALMSSPGLAQNPVMAELYQKLTVYQAARDSLTTGRWGSSTNHPDVQRLDALIGSTRARLVDAVRSVVTGLDARIASLDQMRATSAMGFPDLSRNEEEEARLEEQVESARAMVAQLRAEYEKARLAEAVEVGQVEIVDLGSAPAREMGIGWIRKLTLGTLLGLMVGTALAFLLEHLNSSIRRHDQVRSVLRLPELAVIPRSLLRGSSSPRLRLRRPPGTNGAGVAAVSSGLIAAADLESGGAEAFRLLRTNLLFSSAEEAPRIVLITSPAPGDGKSTVAANLAVSYSQQGMRTLLVDCDLRRGRLHTFFHYDRNPGLAPVLQGKIQLDDAMRSTPIESLMVLTTGALPRAPAELLGNGRLRLLFEELRRRFDVVVLDSPPVLAAADAVVMATGADACVLVLRAGRTAEDQARMSLERLVSVGARVVGAVLNDQDSRLERYGGYYYQGYYGSAAEP